jgi:hypothetical protein
MQNVLLKVGEKRQNQAVFGPQVGQIFQKSAFKMSEPRVMSTRFGSVQNERKR